MNPLEIDLSALFALDPRQEVIVQLAAPGAQSIQTIVRGAQPKVTLRAGEAPSLLAWIRTGMDHIYSGVDHICFVLALLRATGVLCVYGSGFNTNPADGFFRVVFLASPKDLTEIYGLIASFTGEFLAGRGR